jgi:predicted ATPase/class 3 adenylate cyclase
VDRLPSGYVTFCFTDIEGSTQLFAKLGASFLDVLEDHRRIIRTAVAEHGGVEVKTEGDGFFIAFDDPTKAVAAAVRFQRELEAVRVRVGLHAGIAEPTDDDYIAFAVHEAARIGGAAHGGQIVISDALATTLRQNMPDGTTLRDLGMHQLKDLEPMRLHQVIHADLDRDFPPLRTAGARRGYVPAVSSSLIGRDDDLADLAGTLRKARLLTITGAGGVGKTRLAVEVAQRELGRRTDGVWFVDLSPLSDPGWIDDAILEALGVARDDAGTARAQLMSYLANREVLLVVDNCEHLIEACTELIDTILRSNETTAILATSREPLGIDGEVVWRARSLDADAAKKLFVDRARSVSADVANETLSSEAVRRIVERLDGIPLAIELAAARTRVLSTTQIADRLDDRFRLLTGGSRTALPRQRTLEAAVDWSYDLLSDDERELLRRLTVFAGGFDLEAAERVCDGEVLDTLEHLVDKSMVIASLHKDTVRYRLLETIRHYGWLKLIAAGEAAVARDAHAAYFEDLVTTIGDDLVTVRESEAAAALTLEHDNIRAALAWTFETNPAVAARMVAHLWIHWIASGRAAEAAQWIGRALGGSDADADTRARLHTGMAHIGWISETSRDEVRRHADRAVEIARSRDERYWFDAWALYVLAYCLTEDLDADPDVMAEAAEWATAARSDTILSQAIGVQSFRLVSQRRNQEALAKSDEAITVARRSAGVSVIAQALRAKAINLLAMGCPEEAETCALDSVAAAQLGPNVYFRMFSLSTLANAKMNLGRPDADVPTRQEIQLSREMGLDNQLAYGLLDLASWAMLTNDLALARASLEEASSITATFELSRREALLLNGRASMGLGELAQCEGDFALARRIFEGNLAVAEQFAVVAAVAYVNNAIGCLEIDVGDRQAAERAHLAAFSAIADEGDLNWRTRIAAAVVRGLAGVASARGDHARAAHLTGQASGVVDFHANAPPLAAIRHIRLREALRSVLGDTGYETAFAEGAREGLDAAASVLLRA